MSMFCQFTFDIYRSLVIVVRLFSVRIGLVGKAMVRIQIHLYFLAVFITAFSFQAWGDVSVAGLAPDKRPESAPKITQLNKNSKWYSNALTGVSRPYPSSLRFLEDQGNWYTPFSRPGMVDRYDIRGWHNPSKPGDESP